MSPIDSVVSSSSSSCEPTGLQIVSKIIRIVQIALKCNEEEGESSKNSSSTTVQSLYNFNERLEQGERIFAKKLLELLLTSQDKIQNETFFEDFESLQEIGGKSFSPFNNTTSDVEVGLSGGKTMGDSGSRGMNKLQNLELIKVAVLIIVISIIMLTTCRMVFQLFIKFRPEKPQD